MKTIYPEDKVKAAVKKVLADDERFGPIYSYWPVPMGMGASSLDCLVSCRGTFIGIETKTTGMHPTKRQELTIEEMVESGAITLTIDTTDTTMLERILNAICNGKQEKVGVDCRTIHRTKGVLPRFDKRRKQDGDPA